MKRLQNIVLTGLLLALAGCATSEPRTAATPESIVPQKFDFSITGVVGPSYHVELREGFLVYTVTEPGQKPKPPLHLNPTPEQWQAFRHQLNRVKVWQWKTTYGSQAVLGGTQWSLDIEYADRSVHSQGRRDFPSRYSTYLNALQKLLGSWDIR